MSVRFINLDAMRQDPRLSAAYARFGGRPGWVWRAAFTVAALVFIVPIVLLALAALLAFALVFIVLSLVSRVIDLFTGPSRSMSSPHHDDDDAGRRNVRVIRSE